MGRRGQPQCMSFSGRFAPRLPLPHPGAQGPRGHRHLSHLRRPRGPFRSVQRRAAPPWQLLGAPLCARARGKGEGISSGDSRRIVGGSLSATHALPQRVAAGAKECSNIAHQIFLCRTDCLPDLLEHCSVRISRAIPPNRPATFERIWPELARIRPTLATLGRANSGQTSPNSLESGGPIRRNLPRNAHRRRVRATLRSICPAAGLAETDLVSIVRALSRFVPGRATDSPMDCSYNSPKCRRLDRRSVVESGRKHVCG